MCYSLKRQEVTSKRLRWVGHVSRMRKTGNICRIISVEKQKGRDHFEDLGIDGTIILKCVSDKCVVRDSCVSR
jgi:hypothetical protein